MSDGERRFLPSNQSFLATRVEHSISRAHSDGVVERGERQRTCKADVFGPVERKRERNS